MKRITFLLILISALCFGAAKDDSVSKIEYNSYKGLLMAGYQGWFNAPDDGAGRGWYHYEKRGRFSPGSCTIDLWPDVSEYEKLYKTEFTYKDGSPAYLYSAYDSSTVETHFRWMEEYGIDGVFMQRFVGEISRPSGKNHFDTVLAHAMSSANRHSRAICVMYDLSGMPQNGPEILLNDIEMIASEHILFHHEKNPSYLYHNGRPLVCVWGIGFNDGRKYGFPEAEIIINGLKAKGFSVMIGVPTRWRELTSDTVHDKKLHELICKCDIVMPWFVGRYNHDTYPEYKKLIKEDIEWAKGHDVDYAPLCFPGFSWDNMLRPGAPTSLIPRLGGKFFKEQLSWCLKAGAEMIYVAMFDEIDEGTAIFKLASETPVSVPGSTFVQLDRNARPDTYLRLAGWAAGRLK